MEFPCICLFEFKVKTNWSLSLSRKKSADRKKEENINIIYRFNRLKNFLNVEKPMAFQKIFPFCSAQTSPSQYLCTASGYHPK